MTDASATDSAAIETKEEVGKGNPALARFWSMQLNLADKDEDAWRKRARIVCDIYAQSAAKKDVERTDGRRRSVKFNILYSNVQTLAPALLPSIPQPDVRRRFRDDDPVSGMAADILERCAATMCDQYDFAHIAKMAVLDRCLPGRAVVRVQYEPTIENDEETGEPKKITYQSVKCTQVHYQDYRRSPARSWAEVTWQAFRHRLNREECLEMFGEEIGRAIPLNLEQEGLNLHPDDDPNIYKRAEVWEVWDKDERQIIWICKDYQERPLKVQDDTLALQDFFDTPRPLYAIDQPDSLDPIEEFRQYENQARELDKITQRIDKIVSGLRVRGIAASTITEFAQLASAGDNELVMAKSGDTLGALQNASIGDAVWMWPLETAIKALQELYVQREAIKQTIYEIVGISDILRGSVDPKEKLGQSQLKASWGSRRLDTGREEVQRFLRDLIRLKIEIIAEHFEPQQLMMMSGIKLPTMAEKQQVQQQLQQQAQQQAMQQQPQPGMPPGQPGQPPKPPEIPEPIKEMLEKPTIDDVMQVIRSDAMRTFRVEIETDQTIVGDEQAEKQSVTEFLNGMVQYWTGMGPIIQGGFPIEAATSIFNAAARRFKFGRDVEDALESIGEKPLPPPPPDPKMLEAQTNAKMAEQDAGIRQKESADKLAIAQTESQGKLQIAATESQGKLALAREEMQGKMALQAQAEMKRIDNEREIGMKTVEDQTTARRDQFEAAGTPVGQSDGIKAAAQEFKAAAATMAQGQDMLAQAITMMAHALMADTVLIKGPDGKAAGARKVMPQGMTMQ